MDTSTLPARRAAVYDSWSNLLQTNKLLWTLAEGQQLAAELEVIIRPHGYHTLLGGGVLHKGQSDKDLDLWFLPLNGYPNQAHVVLRALYAELGVYHELRDGPDYHMDSLCYCAEMVKFDVCGKRVDVFIL